MPDPIDPNKLDPAYREPVGYDRDTRTTTDADTPVESAHRRGLVTGLVVGVIGGAIVGGIIVGMMETRTTPTQPVATTPERQERIMGVPEEQDLRRDGIRRYDEDDTWPADRRDPATNPGTPR